MRYLCTSLFSIRRSDDITYAGRVWDRSRFYNFVSKIRRVGALWSAETATCLYLPFLFPCCSKNDDSPVIHRSHVTAILHVLWCIGFRRAAEILYSLVAGYSEHWSDSAKLNRWYKDVVKLRQNSAELQHHDAITGAALQTVVASYLEMWALICNIAINLCVTLTCPFQFTVLFITDRFSAYWLDFDLCLVTPSGV